MANSYVVVPFLDSTNDGAFFKQLTAETPREAAEKLWGKEVDSVTPNQLAAEEEAVICSNAQGETLGFMVRTRIL